MLISCIMPTANRQKFVPMAVSCFLAQTHPEKELIVVDDGADSVWSLVQHVPGVVYLRYPQKMSVGRKRNIGCEHAAGEVIAHWDDDDWSSPTRLSDQLASLRKANMEVVGNLPQLFWDGAKAWEYRGDVACGTSLMYYKEYWWHHRFPDVPCGEDSHFSSRASQAKTLAVSTGPLVIASIHSANSSKNYEARGSSYWPEVPIENIPPDYFAAVNQHGLFAR